MKKSCIFLIYSLLFSFPVLAFAISDFASLEKQTLLRQEASPLLVSIVGNKLVICQESPERAVSEEKGRVGFMATTANLGYYYMEACSYTGHCNSESRAEAQREAAERLKLRFATTLAFQNNYSNSYQSNGHVSAGLSADEIRETAENIDEIFVAVPEQKSALFADRPWNPLPPPRPPFLDEGGCMTFHLLKEVKVNLSHIN